MVVVLRNQGLAVDRDGERVQESIISRAEVSKQSATRHLMLSYGDGDGMRL